MSEEGFDNKIKKQLESVRPPYKEDAWKNFQRLLPVPWYVALLRKYGGWTYGGLATIALLSTSYLFTQEKSENEKLHDEIITLKKDIAQDSLTHSQSANSGSLATISPEVEKAADSKKDTVYIIQKTYVDRPVYNNRRSETEKTKPALAEVPELTNNSESKTTGIQRTRTNNNSTSGITDKSTTNIPGNTSGNNRTGTTQNLPQPSSVNNPVISDTSQTKNNLATNTANEQSSEGQIANRKVTPPDSLKLKTKQDSLAKATAANNTKTKPGFNFPAIHARFGLNFDFMGFQKTAFGPAAEIFLRDNISFNTGLLIASPEQERHQAPKEFNQTRGRRFEDMYRDRIPPNDKIEGIKFNTTILRLPLAVNYYLPTKSKLAFIFSGGTLLDLSVFQSVDFETSLQGNPNERNRFEAKPKPATFNNVFYGMGLEYKYGRLVGQLLPYFNYQFRSPEYRTVDPKFGINATFKFDLKKD